MISDRAIRAALNQFRLAVSSMTDPTTTQLQIMLDASLSMTAGDGSKEQRARELAIVLLRLSEQAGLRGRVCVIRGFNRNRIIELDDLSKLARIPFDGPQALGDAWQSEFADDPVAANRVIVSDFLFPGDPHPLVQRACHHATRAWFVQLLDDWELHPTAMAASSFVDIETDEAIEIKLDEAAINGYIAQLDSLRERISNACRIAGAAWITASAATEIAELCGNHLAPAGLLQDTSL